MSLDSLHALLVEELKDLYSAENQLVKALPKMAKAASAPDLKKAIEAHLKETRTQAERLDAIFEELGVSPGRKKCKAMEGLIEEASELMKEEAEPEVLDAALICAAQKVEHYEIAGYGSARAFAQTLELPKVVQLLQQTLDEESAADEKLSKLAEGGINSAAAEAVEEEEEARA